jgi:predicted O-methyltransferase YrrM
VVAQIEKVKKYCVDKNLPSISREQAQFLSILLRMSQSEVIIEVGTLVGYSTLILAKAAPSAEIYTFEQDQKNAEIARNHLTEYNIHNVKIVMGDAKTTLLTIKKQIDFVFLDATKVEYLNYFAAIKQKLHKGSIIIADNTVSHAQQLKTYVAHMRAQYTSVHIPFPKGMELTIL